jgi:hypothetical protein
MSRTMSEEAALYFTAEAALGEQRDEVRFAGAGDAASLQAWLRRVFGSEERAPAAAAAPAGRERREIESRVRAMLALEPVAAAR